MRGETETPHGPGDAAAFQASAPLGHCLMNESPRDVRSLIVGTRAAEDRVTYPDHGRILHRIRARRAPRDTTRWTDLDGAPASGL